VGERILKQLSDIYDNYKQDIAAFKQKYPLIGNYTVEKEVLSQ